MLIKITESCHGGCNHCMNNAVPCDRHMTMDTFIDVLNFTTKYDVAGDALTGGEPSENPQFVDFIHKYYEMKPLGMMLTITTNGQWILEKPEIAHELLNKYPLLFYQVTYDSRYYPNKLDTTKRVLHHKRILIEENVGQIYPQGRAITNNLKCETNAPKCFNVRLIMGQLKAGNENVGLKELFAVLRIQAHKFCIPAVHYDGGIGLGESDLCPTNCSIYDDEDDIIKSILNHECNGCPEALKSFAENALDVLRVC